MKREFKDQLRWGVVILLIGSFAIAAFFQWQHNQPSRNSNALYIALLERSGQLNRDLPKLLDRQTKFERAEVVDYGMRFVYTLINVDKYQQDIDDLEQQVQPQLLRQFCTSDTMELYREQADFFEIRYLDRGGENLFTLRFQRHQCTAF